MISLKILAVLVGSIFGWVGANVFRKKLRKVREVREREEYRRGRDWAEAEHAKGKPLYLVHREGYMINPESGHFQQGIYDYCGNALPKLGA